MNSRLTKNLYCHNSSNRRHRPAIALLITLVLLVVLSMLGYTFSTRISAQRHRDRYIIDYQSARYACDSAIKYALSTLQDINAPAVITRSNEPDFSDLFALTQAEYKDLLEQWADQLSAIESEKLNRLTDINDINDVNFATLAKISALDPNDPNSFTVRGPYGPPWPLISEPLNFEIGSATVTIEIEDENAKYPLGWAMLESRGMRRPALTGFTAFCEWMDINDVEINSLKKDLKEISKIKEFKIELKPINTQAPEDKPPKGKSKSKRRSRRSRRKPSSRRKTITIPASVHTADFAKLFHSSLINTEILGRPTIISETRKESALKYIGLWGSRVVNINTAPRHVLEAAFVFGGDAEKIADEVIQQRMIKPFENIEELKKSLFRYSNAIEKCEDYLTTVSTFFTIRVTATSGVSKASAIIAIIKDGQNAIPIAVISG